MTRFTEIIRSTGLAAETVAQTETLLSQGNSETNLEALFDQIDDSDYSATDWAIALVAFDDWLAKNQITARPVTEMIGYIHCCTMTSAQTLAPPPLDALLVKMLDDYGFDAIQNV